MIKLKNGIAAVLDIGSSKIVCIIARIDVGKPPVIMGIGHQRSQGIRAGLVVDIQAAENAILAAVHAAEKMANISIEDVVVNLSSNTIISQRMQVDIDIGGHEVTTQDISRILEQARDTINTQEQTILHVIPYGYVIDNNTGITNPLGMFGQHLKSNVHIVTAPTSVVRNLQHCLAKCSLQCQAVVAGGYASGLAALSEDERQLGAIMIDMGGGTTNIAIFESDNMVFTGNIPVGGIHITKDIARGLSTSLSYAERVKTLYGNLLAVMQDDTISIDLSDEDENAVEPEISHIARSALVGIIRPRVEEILDMLKQHLQANGYTSLKGLRLVLTGGASQLAGMRELTSDYFQSQTRLAKPPQMEGMAESIKGAGFSGAIGLIYYTQESLPKNGAGEKEGFRFTPAIFTRFLRWFQQNF